LTTSLRRVPQRFADGAVLPDRNEVFFSTSRRSGVFGFPHGGQLVAGLLMAPDLFKKVFPVPPCGFLLVLSARRQLVAGPDMAPDL
jgi:hypothetical protein